MATEGTSKALVIRDPDEEAYRRFVQWFVLPPAMRERMSLPTTLVGLAHELWPNEDLTDAGFRARLKRFRERDTFKEDCRNEAIDIMEQWEGTMMLQGLQMALEGDRNSYPYWRDLMEMQGHIDNTKRVEVNHTVEVRAVQRMSGRELQGKVRKDVKQLPRMEGRSEEEVERLLEAMEVASEIGVVVPTEAKDTDEEVGKDPSEWRRDSGDFTEPTV